MTSGFAVKYAARGLVLLARLPESLRFALGGRGLCLPRLSDAHLLQCETVCQKSHSNVL